MKTIMVVRLSVTLMLFALAPAAGRAQTTVTGAAVNGEWRGTLHLDNSTPELVLEFRMSDIRLAGTVYADGQVWGAMEHGTLKGDTVHFNVDRYDFTGVVTKRQMKLALIMWNGSTRYLTLTKQPDPPKPPDVTTLER